MERMIRRKTGPWFFRGDSANDFYQEMLTTLSLEGERASPRGLPTQELLHVVTRIDLPRRRVLTQYGRKLNPFFNLAESLWILCGSSEPKWIMYYNSKLAQFLDPPMRAFHGAYGERLRRWPRNTHLAYGLGQDLIPRDQLIDCYWALLAAPESRQAVMTLWNATVDNYGVGTADRPCNLAVTFKLRNEALWMSVFNRSNDVVLGLTSTNIVQFSTIQEVLASWLKVEPGPYTHYSDSLHIYESQETVTAAEFDIYDYVVPTPMRKCAPQETERDLQDLYRLATLYQKATDVELLREYDRVTGEQEWAWSECPYWESVGWALLAYSFHKQKDRARAIECVSHMTTADWRVECLRFLADRYDLETEGLEAHMVGALADVLASGGLEGRQALWRYVDQSRQQSLFISSGAKSAPDA